MSMVYCSSLVDQWVKMGLEIRLPGPEGTQTEFRALDASTR